MGLYLVPLPTPHGSIISLSALSDLLDDQVCSKMTQFDRFRPIWSKNDQFGPLLGIVKSDSWAKELSTKYPHNYSYQPRLYPKTQIPPKHRMGRYPCDGFWEWSEKGSFWALLGERTRGEGVMKRQNGVRLSSYQLMDILLIPFHV